MAVTPSLRLSIDVLHVSGLEARHARAFASSLEAALVELFRVNGIPPALTATSSPAWGAAEGTASGAPVGADTGGARALSLDTRHPQQAGVAVARAIYEGLTR